MPFRPFEPSVDLSPQWTPIYLPQLHCALIEMAKDKKIAEKIILEYIFFLSLINSTEEIYNFTTNVSGLLYKISGNENVIKWHNW